MSRMFERLNAWWRAERTRHFLWVPVCFAAGIAAYYNLPTEPPIWLFPAFAAAILGVLGALRRHALPVLLVLLIFMIGAGWANYRAHEHAPLVLRESLSPRPMIGVVRDIERTERGVRLTLSNVTIDDVSRELTPKQVRLSVKFKKGAEFELPPIGSAIHIRAGLMPPMGPALPGGFDFARYFYFRDIGAVGYGLPPWKVLGVDQSATLENRFWSWRANLTDDIVRTLGPETGGIAAGLITGDARAISEADFEALRASNLYHIIAISGEHMVVIAGVIFISLRLLLLLLPKRIGLRPQGKSIAAAVTLLLVTVYLFVTGLPTSAVRAYVMIALVLLAVIFRRHVDPMRSLAIAALLMLAYDPAMLLDPGFQLSFAATLAIIALVEARVLRRPPGIERGPVRNALHLVGTLLLVSVVAEAATTPLAISMFNNASLYGVFANSIATPLVSLFLMPMVAFFFILLPLGLEHFALALLNYGIMGLLALARWVSSFPHAQLFVPSPPSYGMALFVLGLLWLCLWRTRVRRWGLVPILLGVATILTVQTPDMLVGGGLKQIAFRTGDGYVLARGRADSMIPEMWARGVGYKEFPKAETPHWRCDRLGCVGQVKGQKIAFPMDGVAIAEDCEKSKVLITMLKPMKCSSAAKVLDGTALPSGAVTAFWMDERGALRVENSGDWQGKRPWSVGSAEESEED